HPAMKAVIGPRKELGVRTIFNVLGPLTNPAGADAQVIGVYDADLVPIVARALAHMHVDHALVVHGAGLDEITIHETTTVAEVRGSDVEEYTLTPEEMGLDRHEISAIAGGSPTRNAEHMRRVVTGEENGAKRDIVLANAGAALYVGGEASSLADGVEAADRAIADGDAADKLADLQSVVAT
ncbi:MAG: anthranilate phosphoribosyltransferase, partial [Halanaeroarchaeum sp.]